MMRTIFIPKLRLHLILMAAIVAIMTMACGGGEPPVATTKPIIKFADNLYESLWINDAIAKFIIEKGYGYPTETVELTTELAMVTLAKGDVDVWIEMWVEYYPDWFNRETAAGNIIELGDHKTGEYVMFEGPAFWMVPTWLAEEHNIRTVEDMKRPEVVVLFPDLEDPTKGLFTNCAIGTQCSKINPAKMRAYGLDRYYNTLEPGTQGAHDVTLAGAQKQRKPIFSYYWAPTSIFGSYDWTIIEEPPFTKACWEEVNKGIDDATYTPKEACAYNTSQVTKVIHKDLPTKAPDVVEFLEKMVPGTEPLSRTSAWAVENDIQGAWEKAAIYYLKTYEERWKTWMPEENYKKVKEALAKAGA